MPTHNAVQLQLRQRLANILARVGKIDKDLRLLHDQDSEERGNEIENDDVLERLDDMSRAEVARIRDALRRLEAGTYGLCSFCGQPIDAARLQAEPSTASCVACAQ